MESSDRLRRHLLAGQVIPAHPLALDSRRRLDERRQRALTRYYVEAGAGGVAVGVHTTQFGLRDHGLLEPVLQLAVGVAREGANRPFPVVAGAIGDTQNAVREAEIAAACGCDAVLLSLAGLDPLHDDQLIDHCAAVAEVLPLLGFYLQPAVGGRRLGYAFWRALAELPSLVAVKIAPFNRYHTVEVVRAIAASGRADVALYTGNDDSIVHDLVTPFPAGAAGSGATIRMHGGLLGALGRLDPGGGTADGRGEGRPDGRYRAGNPVAARRRRHGDERGAIRCHERLRRVHPRDPGGAAPSGSPRRELDARSRRTTLSRPGC